MTRIFAAVPRAPWRWLLIGIAALLVVLLALAGFFLATFDANSHKDRLAVLVKQKTGRVFAIPGDVRLKLLPMLRLEIDRAVLNEKDSARPFAIIEGVKLSLRLWPLLHSEVILDQVEIGNFSIALTRFANGATNFDDLLSKDDSPSTLRFDLAGVTIKNGSLIFADELAKRNTKLSNLNITSGRLTDNVFAPLRAKFLLANDNPAAVLQTEVTGELKFDLQRKHYQFNRAKVDAQGEMVAIKPASISLTANIDADLREGRSAIQDINAALNGRLGAQTVHGEFAALRLTSQLNSASIEEIKAKLAIDETGKKLVVSALIPNLNSAADKIEASKIKIDFLFEQGPLRSTGEISSALHVDVAKQRVVLPALILTSKTVRDQMTVDFGARSAASLDLTSGDLDASQLVGEWRMQNQQDELGGHWRGALVANITNGEFSLTPLEGDWSGELSGAKATGKASVPVNGNWRDYSARIPSLDLQTSLTWPSSALEASIQGLALGHADLEASTEADQVAAKGVVLNARGHNANGKWQMNLSSPVKMNLAQRRAELTNLSGGINWTGLSKDAKPLVMKLNGSGSADFLREQAQFQLNARLDRSRLDGKFGVIGWADPSYRIDASLDQLDLDRYFPPAAKSISEKPKQKKAPPGNLDLTFLKGLKVDGQIKIDLLKSAGTTARKVRIEMESVSPKKSKL